MGMNQERLTVILVRLFPRKHPVADKYEQVVSGMAYRRNQAGK